MYILQISIGNGCDRREGTIIHEIMHALGFWHEQSRGDRDDHVTILWNNIRAGIYKILFNFDIPTARFLKNNTLKTTTLHISQLIH